MFAQQRRTKKTYNLFYTNRNSWKLQMEMLEDRCVPIYSFNDFTTSIPPFDFYWPSRK